MAPNRTASVRNIGIMAHIDAGKTTVSERILFYSGRTYRIAEVHDGQATMDFMDQERERGITISSAVNEIHWKDTDIYLIDTPGHVDFTVEVERSLRVLDGVIALYDAVAGVEPQSETVWYQANRHKVARIAFVNKMDRPGADFDRCVKEIHDILGGHPIVLQRPIFDGQNFIGVIDLIAQKALYFNEADQGASISEGEIPAAMVNEMQSARDLLIEKLADEDDEIAEAWLEGSEISEAQIKQALRRATISLKAVPVFCGSGLKNKGIQPLMDGIVDYLPAPLDLPQLEGLDFKGNPIKHSREESAPFCGLIFKIQQIEAKKLAFVRIYSGVLKEGDTIQNATQKQSFKIKHIFRLYANRVDRVESAGAGALIAMVKVKGMATGDTLCDPSSLILLERIEANDPVMSISIEPESIKDKDRLVEALNAIHEEDPTIIFEEDTETGELLLRGMGELHLEVACERLKREFNVLVRKGNPTVVCKESLLASACETASFEREHEGDTIFGQVSVEASPLERDAGLVCKLELPEDHPYVRPEIADAIVNAARDAMLYGPNGFEMVDAQVIITHIGADPKGNINLIGSRIAAGEAVRSAYKSAGTKTLEPLMGVDIIAADENIGDLISDLTQRKGIIENLDTDDPLRSVIHAVVPLRNMFGYSMKLRTITHGRGNFSMHFLRFDAL
ncbi:MAG: elongation factor G [Proteobacteria bacterium]|nr:elongation factor G [Pseudomonadota bacterium]